MLLDTHRGTNCSLASSTDTRKKFELIRKHNVMLTVCHKTLLLSVGIKFKEIICGI